eukprot:6180542-Pleurochrysis_carterae.AAC.2
MDSTPPNECGRTCAADTSGGTVDHEGLKSGQVDAAERALLTQAEGRSTMKRSRADRDMLLAYSSQKMDSQHHQSEHSSTRNMSQSA